MKQIKLLVSRQMENGKFWENYCCKRGGRLNVSSKSFRLRALKAFVPKATIKARRAIKMKNGFLTESLCFSARKLRREVKFLQRKNLLLSRFIIVLFCGWRKRRAPRRQMMEINCSIIKFSCKRERHKKLMRKLSFDMLLIPVSCRDFWEKLLITWKVFRSALN